MTDQGKADLVVEGLVVRYGGVQAVSDASFEVRAGQVVALLGANGAGKTSTLTSLIGANQGATSGSISALGKSTRRPRAATMARRGIALVPEGRRVFAPLSVEENLLVGGYTTKRRRVRELVAEMYDLFPILGERRDSPAGLLSGGEQQMLAFGRAMMSEPRLILMDEPSMGLSPIMVDRVMGAITSINERGTSILLVEQNAYAALSVASYAYVLERGEIVRSGSSAELRQDPIVAEAFLGLRAAAD
jgi:branched-chain amino acid transport system ATP-binding protein